MQRRASCPQCLLPTPYGLAADLWHVRPDRDEAPPPELDEGHYLVKAAERILGCCASVSGLGTEASEYSKLAPCLIYGPGHISCAHMPTEYIEEEQFYNSIETFRNLALHLV
ncbi:M20/M25/M40 family metallo-hydrolase [Paraburkholderia xenovorans]|uniref:M20/M25/M40 family metallo-hydrolase n=1 Tax=Paraburkholderia xenovorans TaxID=36873 RepID=UPI0038B78F6D